MRLCELFVQTMSVTVFTFHQHFFLKVPIIQYLRKIAHQFYCDYILHDAWSGNFHWKFLCWPLMGCKGGACSNNRLKQISLLRIPTSAYNLWMFSEHLCLCIVPLLNWGYKKGLVPMISICLTWYARWFHRWYIWSILLIRRL